MLARIVAIVYLIVAVAAAYSSLNDTHSETKTANGKYLPERENDTARIPKVYALKTLNNVLTKIMDRKKVTKRPSPLTTQPTTAKPKIECKDSGDLIIILDNTKTLSEKEYARVLDFVATVSAAWRSNLKCRIAFIPQFVGDLDAQSGNTPMKIEIVDFKMTETLDEYEIKAEVYKIQYGKDKEDSKEENLKQAVEGVTMLISNHIQTPPVQTNVLLITATAMYGTNKEEVKKEIKALTTLPNVNTLAIGVSGMVQEDLLNTFAKGTPMKVKLVQSVEQLKDCTDFVQENLK